MQIIWNVNKRNKTKSHKWKSNEKKKITAKILHYEKKTKTFYWTFVVGVPGSRRGWFNTLKLTLNTITQPVERPAIIYLN